ncbi:MAG: fused MFS/spermidine synthase [Magnetococcales bacterium]|nr:fused MFS/spermidine synthase [Magnetococcales bacterium]MBF0261110.1 fused MFS/spermidine synthase [Magnetococcales bacterium]
MNMKSMLVYLVAGWSGYYVMAVELLGGRALSPFFGTGIYVWGAIIALFMLALSIGYLIGGQFSTHQPSLRKLSLLLGLATLTSLPCATFSTPILEKVFEMVPDPRYGALLASFLLFFLPITISGTISPYAIRLLTHGLGDSGQVAGKVFFISTFGSTAGTLLTSFYLVLLFELNQIIHGMLAISFAIAVIGVIAGGQKSEPSHGA